MGDPTSIRYLGIMNFLGQGVPKNNTKAKDYLQKAVQAGDIEAKKYLNALKRL
jgi:TPR repeat protein